MSAGSDQIREHSWDLDFWEMTAEELLEFLRQPRRFLAEIGVDLPGDCRVETVIENHDWIAERTNGFASTPGIVCNVAGGNVAREVYRVSMYGHHEAHVRRFEKRLLHEIDVEEVRESRPVRGVSR